MLINKVIFITLDSFRAKRLGGASYYLPLTPTLDRLAREGIYCTQTLSPAACTQMAHPSIWTSTLPLDHGGYDQGITNRPRSFVELFQRQGFRTVGFSDCFFLSDFFGYTRGFDETYPLYHPKRSWQALYSNYFSHYLHQLRTGTISEQTFVALALPLFRKELRFLQALSLQQEQLLQQRVIPPHPLLDQTPFAQLRNFCHATEQQLEQGGATYFLEQLDQLLTPKLFQAAGLSAPPPRATYIKRKLYNQLNACRQTPFYPLAVADWQHRGQQINDTSLMINGAYTVQTALNWLQKHHSEKLFLWLALADTHELIAGNSALPNPLHWPRLWLDRLRLGQPHPGSFLYDLAVKYEDSLIDHLLRTMAQQLGHLDDTLVIICADHGRQWWLDGERSQRPHRETLDFYEEDLHVPLIFWHRALGAQRIDQLCGLVDLAPTLVDLMGWPSEPTFQGHPVYSTAVQNRSHLLLEDAGRGPCDLAQNSLRIAVRTPGHKYIWQAATAAGAARDELYDLRQDPQERHNLSTGADKQSLAQQLKAIAQARNQQVKASVTAQQPLSI